MLKVKNISKSYGHHTVLKDVSFSAKQGEIIGLVGENGAGKSTLLSIIATLRQADAGDVFINDRSVTKQKKDVRKISGFVPQEIALWEEFTVAENMQFFEKLAWKKQDKTALKQLCLDVKLDKWDEKVSTLSGGMKRKLNLAISLIHEPRILLLDEPTAGIDMKSRQEIGEYLKDLATTRGVLIIYTSHDMGEITTLCDWVICLGADPFYYDLLTAQGLPTLQL